VELVKLSIDAVCDSENGVEVERLVALQRDAEFVVHFMVLLLHSVQVELVVGLSSMLQQSSRLLRFLQLLHSRRPPDEYEEQ
jgi:hypothetical protein